MFGNQHLAFGGGEDSGNGAIAEGSGAQSFPESASKIANISMNKGTEDLDL